MLSCEFTSTKHEVESQRCNDMPFAHGISFDDDILSGNDVIHVVYKLAQSSWPDEPSAVRKIWRFKNHQVFCEEPLQIIFWVANSGVEALHCCYEVRSDV